MNNNPLTKQVNWGILGLGHIAHKFVQDLQLSTKSKLHAVASRDIEKANEVGRKYDAIKCYGNYAEIATDPTVDVVYIATPHSFHFENTMMCLQAGKSVLCEKPMGLNAKEVATLIQEARARKLFLMEALWTRFIPSTEKVLELIADGVIGKINFLHADFGFVGSKDPKNRILNKALGGGSLLDIGIYPVYLSMLLLGMPNEIKAMARFTDTSVDSYCSVLMNFARGEKANLYSTIEAETPTEATIYGEKGTIKMHRPFHHSEKISLILNNGSAKDFEIKYKGNGYFHEIEEVENCLKNGKTESDKHSLSDSLNLINILDRIKQGY
ncbi:MAG: Gfo/Idh/MocA family oxidoreductase [Bacteroidales bacterium]|nr:Gfo/Idh/MocA family oxidoreductase [Bacteroidales bacterium]